MSRFARALILSLAVLALMASCFREPTVPKAYEYLIGVSLANLTEPWRISMSEEIKAEASHFPNLRIVFADAADSSGRQIMDVHKLLDSGIDLLIISPE